MTEEQIKNEIRKASDLIADWNWDGIIENLEKYEEREAVKALVNVVGTFARSNRQLLQQKKQLIEALERIKENAKYSDTPASDSMKIADKALQQIQGNTCNNDGVVTSSPYISEKKLTGKISQGNT